MKGQKTPKKQNIKGLRDKALTVLIDLQRSDGKRTPRLPKTLLNLGEALPLYPLSGYKNSKLKT